MSDVFLGLDGEMTGGDMQPPGQRPNFQKFALVQIGLAYLERRPMDDALLADLKVKNPALDPLPGLWKNASKFYWWTWV